MKIQKNKRSLLKYYLLDSKIYNKLSLNTNSDYQLSFNFKVLNSQVKKVINFFFKLMTKNKDLKTFIFYHLLAITKKKNLILKKKLINFNLFYFFFKKKLISIPFLKKLVKSSFIKLFCFFSSHYYKKNKVLKVKGDLTNIIILSNLKTLKKLQLFSCLNYLIFLNVSNLTSILQIFYFLIVKIYKLNTRKKFIKI